MKTNQKLSNKAKKFPDRPGVYWFLKNGEKIYIGRASSIKKRIASYFRRLGDPRISEMVGSATDVSFKKTANLLEAVILEANLIKKYLPKYNIKEKDDRSFLYLVIPKEDFPRPFIARGREVKKYLAGNGRVFGPFESRRVIETAFNLARRIFPFGICKSGRGRPCFDYQIGLCPGVCIGAISKREYGKNIKNLILLFEGRRKRLAEKLKKENPEKLFALKRVQDVALVGKSQIGNFRSEKNFRRVECYDISHLSGTGAVGAMAVFTNGEADKSQYRIFKIKNTANRFDDLAMIEEVLNRRFNHDEWPRPDVVLIDGGRNQVERARKILAEKNIFISIAGFAKTLGHSGRAAEGDKFFFANADSEIKKLLLASRRQFQQARNEAHRFAISFQRRTRKMKLS